MGYLEPTDSYMVITSSELAPALGWKRVFK
jgi:hypothetical protein